MANAKSGGGLDKLNDELQDVTRIMTKNMEDLLWRGDSLDRMFRWSNPRIRLIICPLPSFYRHVDNVLFPSRRIAQVPESGEAYQPASSVPKMGVSRRARPDDDDLAVVAFLVVVSNLQCIKTPRGGREAPIDGEAKKWFAMLQQ